MKVLLFKEPFFIYYNNCGVYYIKMHCYRFATSQRPFATCGEWYPQSFQQLYRNTFKLIKVLYVQGVSDRLLFTLFHNKTIEGVNNYLKHPVCTMATIKGKKALPILSFY